MTANGWLQIFFFCCWWCSLVTKPLGAFMARVFGRERTWLDPGDAAGGTDSLPAYGRG